MHDASCQEVAVGEIMDRVAHQGYGLVFVLLAAPMAVPILPPGASTVVGLLYTLLAVQMLTGRRQPWLPERARSWRVSPAAAAMISARVLPLMRRLERFSRPRGLSTAAPLVIWLIAALVLLTGLILASPFPFMNLLPTVALVLFGIGLLNEDAVFLLGGAAISLIVILVVVSGLG
ncbi:MAG: exopolysaccharide biosynthesis protein, partial [Armatimonadetes bacterium]|nr:exopolysaccharide biosynthesis protein [Armatimonadota bacterium]